MWSMGLSPIAGLEFQLFVLSLIGSIEFGEEASRKIPVKALKALLNRSWWRRIWTLQEFAMAENPTIFCGSDMLNWKDIHRGYLTILLEIRTVSSFKPQNYESMAYSMNFSVLARSEVQKALAEVGSPSLLSLMMDIQSSGRRCLDPRDYIFGVLGMIGDIVARQVNVNYGESIIKLFTHVATLLLESSGLAVFSWCHVGINSLEDHEERALWSSNISAELPKISKFPSWVPMWHRNMPRPINSVTKSKSDHINYHASVEIPSDTMLWFSSIGSLILEGAVVGYVFELEDWPSETSSEFDWFAMIETLMKDSTIYKTPREKKEALWRTPCADRIWDLYALNVRRAQEHDLDSFQELVTPGGNTTPVLSYATRVYAKSVGDVKGLTRSIYATKKGSLGLGLSSLKVDDVVCIFYQELEF